MLTTRKKWNFKKGDKVIKISDMNRSPIEYTVQEPDFRPGLFYITNDTGAGFVASKNNYMPLYLPKLELERYED